MIHTGARWCAVVRGLFEKNEAARIFSALILVMGAAPVFAPLPGGIQFTFAAIAAALPGAIHA